MERRVWASSSVCVMADPPKALKVVRPHLAPALFLIFTDSRKDGNPQLAVWARNRDRAQTTKICIVPGA